MRTTLHIDDDICEAIRSLAAIERRRVGKVLSDLARRALRPSRPPGSVARFPVCDVRDGAPPLAAEMVREALDEA